MGSFSQQPVVVTHEEDRERQEATNENRSCLHGLVHTRLSMYMLGLSSGQAVRCPRARDCCCACKLISQKLEVTSVHTHCLCRWNQTLRPHRFYPGALWSLIRLCSYQEEIAPEWLTKNVCGLRVKQACAVESISPQASCWRNIIVWQRASEVKQRLSVMSTGV